MVTEHMFFCVVPDRMLLGVTGALVWYCWGPCTLYPASGRLKGFEGLRSFNWIARTGRPWLLQIRFVKS
jgi:hypothetical protein